MKRLTTRGIKTAEAIRDGVEFDTSGALRARTCGAGTGAPYSTGHLSGDDLVRFNHDRPAIRYVVYSYATPIAWRLASGHWYKVKAKFSLTTTKHQGNLYLIEDTDRVNAQAKAYAAMTETAR